MKPHPLVACAFLTALLTLSLHADTVVLKSGEKVDGKIIQENDTEVQVEVQVSASIKDIKVIPKTDVEKIEKAGEDAAAFALVREYKLDEQNSLPADAYDRIISSLQDFVMRFPASQHTATVQDALNAFKAERERVAKGEVKAFGRWLTPDEAERNKFQIAANQQFVLMKQMAARGDVAGVLNGLDTIEKRFQGARVYPDAVAMSVQILTGVQKELDRRLADIAKERTALKSVVDMASEPRKSQLIAAARSELQRYETAMAAAEKAGQKWKPYLPKHEPSVQAYKNSVSGELSRLAALPVAAMRESVQLSDQAEAAFGRKEYHAAQQFLQDARSRWGQNAALNALSTAVTEAAKAPTATPTPTPTATPEITPDPATTGTATEVTTTGHGTVKKMLAEGEDPEATPEGSANAAGEKKPFYMTVPGALTILGGVLALIAIINFAGKMSARAKARERDEQS